MTQTISDFLIHGALYFAFKKLDNPAINRNDCLYAFALSKTWKSDDRTMACIDRMTRYRSKSGFVFDQYFYYAFGYTPHTESESVLPKIQSCGAVLQR